MAEVAEKKSEDTPKYGVEDLLENPRALTGFSKHLVAGAFHGYDGSKVTPEQARKRVSAFASREVQR